jgi:penicillin-binding protein 1A
MLSSKYRPYRFIHLARTTQKKSSTIRRKSQNKMRRHFRWKRWLFLTLLFGFVFAGTVIGIYAWRASRFDLKGVTEMRERSTVFDMDGKIWSRLQGENRVPVKLAGVSKFFLASLLTREDTRFYSHWGVDPKGLLRAVVRTAQGQQQGGSTLTQQLARNSYDALGQRKSFDRKLLEVFVALRIEQKYSKDEILEHYMNRIYFGSGVYGIEMASKAYFGKSAADLTLSEAAMIAGIIRAPTKASPFTNLDRARAERDSVLDRMATGDCAGIREKYGVTPELIAAAKKQPLKVIPARRATTQENYAMDMVMRELDLILDDDQQDAGGLKIYTTIDPVLQDEAQKSLDRALTKIEQRPGYQHPKKSQFTEEARKAELPTDYLQGSVVVVDNRTGGIRALIGGRDYRESKFNRAIEARRTVGSTFKPFVYAAAFARGLSPDDEISDAPIQAGEIDGAPGWRPGNSDDKFNGPLPVAEGLIRSRNTMTVRVGNRAGIDAVAAMAAQAGLGDIPRNPQSYIGNFGATPRDMTLAYSMLANNGQRRQGYLIERIDNAEGEVIYRAAHASYRAADPGICATTTAVLSEVMQRGTAASAKSLGWNKPSAGKTGTTDDYHDAWFVGYTTTLTCGVWVGLDKPATIVPKGYGATLALPVWVDVMKRADPGKYPAEDFFRSSARKVAAVRPPVVNDPSDTPLRPTVVDQTPALRRPDPKPDATPDPKPDGEVLRSFRKFIDRQ